jgi:hypothetical protein
VKNLDRTALLQGALVSLVFAFPFAVGARLVADNDKGSPWASVLWLLALGGFVLGAGCAAWVQEQRLPLLHATVAAGGTYVAAQAVFIVIKLFRGGDVSWLGAFFTFTTVLFAALIGGFLGAALRKRGTLPSGKRR